MFTGTALPALARQGYSPIIFLALIMVAAPLGTRIRKGFIILVHIETVGFLIRLNDLLTG